MSANNGVKTSYEYDQYGNVTKTTVDNRLTEAINTTDYFTIRPVSGDLYYGIENNTDGTNIKLIKYDSTKALWKFVDVGNGYYQIVPKFASNKALDTSGNFTNLSKFHIWGLSSTNVNQYFKPVKQSNNNLYLLKSKQSNDASCVSRDINKKFEVGVILINYECDGGYGQLFAIEKAEVEANRYYKTENIYSANGNYLTSKKDVRDKVTEYTYNTNTGTTTKIKDPKNVETNYTYDTMNKMLSVNSTNVTNTYNYSKDYLNEIIHNSITYKFAYDTFGNVSNIKLNNQNLITNTYATNNGNLTKSTYGNGNEISYEYDIFNRITKTTKSNGYIQNTYDNRGNIAKTYDSANGASKKMLYDLNGRMSSYQETKGSNKFLVTPLYDSYSRNSEVKYNLNTTSNSRKYTYDNLNKTTKIENHINGTLSNSISYIYASLDRLSEIIITKGTNSFKVLNGYWAISTPRQSPLVNSLTYTKNGVADGVYAYTYDNLANITQIKKDSKETNTYTYDNLNQLIKEDNLDLNKTMEYTYDTGGNITSKKYYNYKTTTLTETINYTYGNTNWKDQLTSYNGNNITYDSIGNPLTYKNMTFSWINGRQLSSIVKTNPNETITYKYNESGIRNYKKVGSTEYNYYLEGSSIIYETRGTNTIYYLYDNSGIIGLRYNSTEYFYKKNLQGDIISILDSNMNVVANYVYDSWGKVISVKNASGTVITDQNNIGHLNPFRYRSYYYDQETELYYLNSRYYNPELGRFLNADGIMGANEDMLGYNLYVYCSNNPISYGDPSGKAFEWLLTPRYTYDPNPFQTAIDKAKETAKKSAAPDYSKEINKVVAQNVAVSQTKSALSIKDTLWFYNQVNHNGPWDYKRQTQWEKDFNVPFLEYNGYFIWDNEIMTAEDFGNIHYGIVGTAVGYSPTILHMGAGYAQVGALNAVMAGPPYWGDERTDYMWIKQGISYYNNR